STYQQPTPAQHLHQKSSYELPIRTYHRSSAPVLTKEGAMITFECSGCNRKLQAKEERAGKKVKCPQCGQVVLIPSEAVSVLAGAAPPAPSPGTPHLTGTDGPTAAPQGQGPGQDTLNVT